MIVVEPVNARSTHTGSIKDICVVALKQLCVCSFVINPSKIVASDVVGVMELKRTSRCKHGSF